MCYVSMDHAIILAGKQLVMLMGVFCTTWGGYLIPFLVWEMLVLSYEWFPFVGGGTVGKQLVMLMGVLCTTWGGYLIQFLVWQKLVISYEWFPLLVGELCGLSATQEISLSIIVLSMDHVIILAGKQLVMLTGVLCTTWGGYLIPFLVWEKLVLSLWMVPLVGGGTLWSIGHTRDISFHNCCWPALW